MIRSNLEASAGHVAQKPERVRHAKRRQFGIMFTTAPEMAAANFTADYRQGRKKSASLPPKKRVSYCQKVTPKVTPARKEKGATCVTP
jgi:hypothetical protein